MMLLAIPDDHMQEVLREYQEKARQSPDESTSEVISRPAQLSPADWDEITQAQQ